MLPHVQPFLVGILFAWSLAATPGPANALIAREAARRGWRAGWLTGLGAVTGDLVMFTLMWGGALVLLQGLPWVRPLVPWVRPALGLVGAALLAWFAWGTWRTARRHAADPEVEGRGSFGRSFLIVVTSPLNWGWWVTAGAAMLATLGFVGMGGFFGGLLAWIALWSALARLGAVHVRGFVEGVAYASAVVLAAFAAWLAYVTVSDLLAAAGA